jgi:hypothetical protein
VQWRARTHGVCCERVQATSLSLYDEVGAVAALLMGPDGGFITGSDFLMDGGVTAAYWYGEVAEVREK